MRTLLLKSVALLAPFIAMSLPTVVHTVGVVIRAEQSVALRHGVFNEQLEGKYLALVRSDTEVIIAGDSRGERQIVPAVVAARTGWKTVNIGTNGGDLVTLGNALERHGLPPAARILVVSVSLFQANDGAIDPGYVSTACFLNMTTWERIGVYADRLATPWSPLSFPLTEAPPAVISGSRLREQGFLGVEGTLELPLPKVLLESHPWYRELSLHGARWRIFRESLERLARHDIQIYLFQPPVSPAWRAYTRGTMVDSGELEYGRMLRSVTRGYNNVRFLDFYSDSEPRLGNPQYYDIQHLNRGGAETFTKILTEKIVRVLRPDGPSLR